MENWKTIYGNTNYMVSNTGKVKSFNYRSDGKLLTLSTRSNSDKYVYKNKNRRKLYAVLCKNYSKKPYPVNELVYRAFVGEIPEGYTVYNKNGNFLDNRVDNLILVKKSENLCLKIAFDTEVEKKEKKQYVYYINNKRVGLLSEFLKYIPKQSRANISERFCRWEKRKNKDVRGVLFGNNYCQRKVEYVNCNHINKLKTLKEKYGI